MISTEFLMIKVNNISVRNNLALFYWSVIFRFKVLFLQLPLIRKEKQNQALSREQLTKFLLSLTFTSYKIVLCITGKIL